MRIRTKHPPRTHQPAILPHTPIGIHILLIRIKQRLLLLPTPNRPNRVTQSAMNRRQMRPNQVIREPDVLRGICALGRNIAVATSTGISITIGAGTGVGARIAVAVGVRVNAEAESGPGIGVRITARVGAGSGHIYIRHANTKLCNGKQGTS